MIYRHSVTRIDRPFFLSDKRETIVAIKVDWMCSCANFIDTAKYRINPVSEADDNDYFFIEPARPELDWDRDTSLKNGYLRLTGQFYVDKGIPEEFELGHIEDKPDHARVFRYDKIEYLTGNN